MNMLALFIDIIFSTTDLKPVFEYSIRAIILPWLSMTNLDIRLVEYEPIRLI